MPSIELQNGSEILSLTLRKADDNELYELVDSSKKCYLRFKIKGTDYEIKSHKSPINIEDEDFNSKLDLLVLDIIEQEQSGTEFETDEDIINPYNPDDIKVSPKQFSLKLIKEMVDSKDLDLNPNFQRHMVWDAKRRSRLIESILLRIPLPMFYFSEDKEGKLAVIDGLQRISAINDFMNNKFALKDLEYLQDNCEGKYYKTLEPKYIRWFNLTQIFGNVIDPSSPYKVKYDIFKRINTGGKPLNNQEIRNCLAGQGLRETLKQMVSLKEFKKATDNGIKPTRMDDEEVALRFILFRRLMTEDKKIDKYNGYMDASLNELTEKLQLESTDNLSIYITEFSIAMNNAEYLFGSKYAFRKVKIKDIQPNAWKRLINKALFVSCSVLLADYDPEKVRRLNKKEKLLKPLAKAIENDNKLWSYLSYGTNGKANLQYTFSCINKIITEHLTK